MFAYLSGWPALSRHTASQWLSQPPFRTEHSWVLALNTSPVILWVLFSPGMCGDFMISSIYSSVSLCLPYPQVIVGRKWKCLSEKSGRFFFNLKNIITHLNIVPPPRNLEFREGKCLAKFPPKWWNQECNLILLTYISLINSDVIGSHYLVEILTKFLFGLCGHWLKLLIFL